MRIAIDIDSTLHHYWDLLSQTAHKRFGVDLPYDQQVTWGITRLRDEQLALCVKETHSDENILAGRPYPAAVETINRWRDAGHTVCIASHRPTACIAATRSWLEAIGLQFDDLHCSWDKVTHAVETNVDLLIDDSPENLLRALEHGITAATIAHPWNRDVREEEDVISGEDWPSLAAALEAALPPLRRRPAA